MVAGLLGLARPAAAEATTASAPETTLTSTRDVEAIAVHDGALVVASRGGLELYDLDRPVRLAHFGPESGLGSPHVRALERRGPALVARTDARACVVARARLTCHDEPLPPATPTVRVGVVAGHRVTTEARDGARVFVGTAGAGVVRTDGGERAWSAPAQLASSHVVALATFRRGTWMGTFHDGLCVLEDGGGPPRVRCPEVGARMINALAVTPEGLFVAAHEGLFRSKDGVRFAPVPRLAARGVNGLAWDGQTLWVTNPGALYAVDPTGRTRTRTLVAPGGSRAIQRVAASANGDLWLASEDRGAIRVRGGLGGAVDVFDKGRGLPTSWVLDVAVDARGTAYLATLRDGVLALRDDGSFAALAGLPDRWVLDVHVAGDTLYVGTQDGAARVDLATGRTEPIRGLPDRHVHAFEAVGGRLVVATEKGVKLTTAAPRPAS